jgi:endonuclease/exonuclease/phosphatase family metal-dependent hydrolase
MQRITLLFALLFSTSALAKEFKVATFNVWGVTRPFIKDASRFRDIPKEFDRLDVDVILVQETFTPVSRRSTKVKTYPYYVRGPRFWGRFLSSGLQIISRWPIVRAESRVFSDCEGFDCLARKGGVIATIERPDGVRVDIMNTHLNAGGSASMKRNQIDTLKITIDTYRGKNPLVIGGDFNLSEVRNPDLYAHLMKQIPSQDTYKVWANSPDGQGYPEDVRAGYTSDSLNNSWKIRAGDTGRARIDMLLLKNQKAGTQLKVKSSRLILNEMYNGRHLSDHFGVETTFDVIEDAPAALAQ